jgi:hypothetical protein
MSLRDNFTTLRKKIQHDMPGTLNELISQAAESPKNRAKMQALIRTIADEDVDRLRKDYTREQVLRKLDQIIEMLDIVAGKDL